MISTFNTDFDTDTASEGDDDMIGDTERVDESIDATEDNDIHSRCVTDIDSLNVRIKLLEKKVDSQQATIMILRASNNKLCSKSFRLTFKCKPKSPIKPLDRIQKSNLKNFLVRQLEHDKKTRGNRYNCDEKMFALSLWHASPKCYRLLRTTFSLPSICTLRRSIQMIDMTPGFHANIFNSIKEKADTFNRKESLVAIAFDEMSIKTHLQYNERIDSVIVFEDLGNGERSDKLATYATVFMVRSIFGSWKQSVGYFLTSGPMNSTVITSKLKECIEKVVNCGLIPKVVICDQGPNNRGCHSRLGITEFQNFTHCGMTLYFMYDPPHLLKSIRNGLFNNGFYYNSNLISFTYIKELYNIKREKKIEIAGRLTEKHINLSTFSKMRVDYATQTLSHSVASGLRTVVLLSDRLPKEAIHTAEFCELFNNLFDIFNSKGNSCSLFLYIYIYNIM